MSKVVDEFDMLAYDEGLKLSIYKDTEGYWTVGIGHLLTKNPSREVAIAALDNLVGRSTGGKITEAEARKIFRLDVDKAVKGIQKSSILAPIYNDVNDARKKAIINMVFQMGQAGAESFKNSLTLVRNHYYTKAAANMRQSKWYRQTPNRAERVIMVLKTGTLDSYN